MPSKNTTTKSISPDVVVSVGAPPGNLTSVDPSVVNVAVLLAAPNVIIKVILVPAVILANVKTVVSFNVIVCTGAAVASTVILPEVPDIAFIVSFGACLKVVNDELLVPISIFAVFEL